MLTEADIREALRACYATPPGFPHAVDILDLGLLESLLLTPDPDAPGANIPGVPPRHRLTLTLLSPDPANEDAQAQLHAQISNRLAGIEQLSRIEIHFDPIPAWTPARLTPDARRILAPAPFPILNNKRGAP